MPDLEYFGSDWIDAETPEEDDDGRCPDCGASVCDECDEDCPSWYADYMEREAQKEADRG